MTPTCPPICSFPRCTFVHRYATYIPVHTPRWPAGAPTVHWTSWSHQLGHSCIPLDPLTPHPPAAVTHPYIHGAADPCCTYLYPYEFSPICCAVELRLIDTCCDTYPYRVPSQRIYKPASPTTSPTVQEMLRIAVLSDIHPTHPVSPPSRIV